MRSEPQPEHASPRRHRILAGSIVALLCACGLATFTATQVDASIAPCAWLWPVEEAPSVTRAFDLTTDYGAGHRGIDIAARPGAAVLAPTAGTIRFAGFVVDRPVLSLQHADGSVTSYEPVVSDLSQGSAVHPGQRIGVLSPAHRHTPEGALHLGLRQGGSYADPARCFGALRPPAAVLLPLYR
ncbi:peptidoglycan DD-metalloendopeptidase family protein [Pseudoclavibacter helvolus]|uniref:peptidoglycan DD-metalloendopeptidase family protein n=1 Tax=Pseudoclavibacter helvolus TaxID=255205 RepID=UPI003C7475D2